jgi:hypothetical protein
VEIYLNFHKIKKIKYVQIGEEVVTRTRVGQLAQSMREVKVKKNKNSW